MITIKLGLGVIYQKTVREHPSTDISNTVLDDSSTQYPETQVSVAEKKGITVCAVG